MTDDYMASCGYRRDNRLVMESLVTNDKGERTKNWVHQKGRQLARTPSLKGLCNEHDRAVGGYGLVILNIEHLQHTSVK